MVADDPSSWELARRLDQIYEAVRDLVGRAEYTEYQRNIEHRFTELGRDIDDVRHQHTEDVRELHKRIGEEAEKAQAHAQWKTMLWIGLIPSLAAIAGILVTIWLHGKG